MPAQYVGRGLQPFFGLESLATAGVQDRAAVMNDARDAAQVHLVIVPVERIVEILVEQPLVAAADSDDVIAERNRSPHHRADTGIHARGVAAACEHADTQCWPPAVMPRPPGRCYVPPRAMPWALLFGPFKAEFGLPYLPNVVWTKLRARAR